MKPAILLLALTSIALGQGPLEPPGPPGLTLRTLNEIESRIPLNQTNTPGDETCVFKITKAGSYILTGNIKPPAGKHGLVSEVVIPGVVVVDMKGFTIDGTDAGPTAVGVALNPSAAFEDMRDGMLVHGGTIRNFTAGSCLAAPSFTLGTLELRDMHLIGGGPGASTGARLLLSNVSFSGGTGIPIQMGNDSVLDGVTIKTSHPGIPKIIQGGEFVVFGDVVISSVMSGSTHATAIELGAGSRIHNLRLRLTDAIFTGPILSNTSGFTEVSGLNVELNNVTAPVVSNSFSWGMSQTGLIGTTYGGDGQGFTFQKIESVIAATNCTFSSAVVILPAGLTTSLNNAAAFKLMGTTTTPTVVRVEADNFSVERFDLLISNTATVSGAVIDIAASGTTIRANIRGGNMGVRLGSGTGNTVEGCNFTGLLAPAVGIQISSGVTSSLVRNNTAARLAAGGVLVQNSGGSTNFIAPTITTPAQLNTNTNPFANIVH